MTEGKNQVYRKMCDSHKLCIVFTGPQKVNILRLPLEINFLCIIYSEPLLTGHRHDDRSRASSRVPTP
jgi:hypothetical protein